MSLAEINKALDALDPNRLDERGVEDWAIAKIAQAPKVAPEHRGAFLTHTRKQVGEAQAAFAKGETKFTITEFKTPSQPGSDSSGSKLAKALADLEEASKVDAEGAGSAEGDEDAEAEDDGTSKVDAEGTESEGAAAKSAPKKPARKAAPDDVGVEKGFRTVESDDDVWGSSLGASMSKVKLGTDGELYVRD